MVAHLFSSSSSPHVCVHRYLRAMNPSPPRIPEWPLWSFYAILSVFMVVLLSGGFFVVLWKANIRTN